MYNSYASSPRQHLPEGFQAAVQSGRVSSTFPLRPHPYQVTQREQHRALSSTTVPCNYTPPPAYPVAPPPPEPKSYVKVPAKAVLSAVERRLAEEAEAGQYESPRPPPAAASHVIPFLSPADAASLAREMLVHHRLQGGSCDASSPVEAESKARALMADWRYNKRLEMYLDSLQGSKRPPHQQLVVHTKLADVSPTDHWVALRQEMRELAKKMEEADEALMCHCHAPPTQRYVQGSWGSPPPPQSRRGDIPYTDHSTSAARALQSGQSPRGAMFPRDFGEYDEPHYYETSHLEKCENCGARCLPSSLYCQNCATPLYVDCSNCGTVNSGVAKFCIGCHKELVLISDQALRESRTKSKKPKKEKKDKKDKKGKKDKKDKKKKKK
eukprot:Sspe_Gene.112729::Locus_95985_Transcript_1_1_Confidence_1.000_Length_1216::g.112729::m.112729